MGVEAESESETRWLWLTSGFSPRIADTEQVFASERRFVVLRHTL